MFFKFADATLTCYLVLECISNRLLSYIVMGLCVLYTLYINVVLVLFYPIGSHTFLDLAVHNTQTFCCLSLVLMVFINRESLIMNITPLFVYSFFLILFFLGD